MAISAPTNVVLWIFSALHLVHLLIILQVGRSYFSFRNLWFWLLILILLLVPGAYLEFPSDPWEHLRRIFAWDSVGHMADGYQKWRFAYFWNWTLLGWLPIEWRFLGLDVCSALWQGILLYQWFRFLRNFEKNLPWRYIHVLGFLFLFGHNIFGIRYYALSSTPLAYIGYLAFLNALIPVLDNFRNLPRSLFELTTGALLCSFNHVQCLLFLLLTGTVWAIFSLYQSLGKKVRLAFILSLVAIFGLSLIGGAILVKSHPNLYSRMTLEKVSAVGTFQVWQPHSRFIETWGIHGLIAIVFALFLFKLFPLPSLMTLSPALLLLFPPAVLFISRKFNIDVPYRVLYAGPSSLMLFLGIKKLLPNIGRSRNKICLAFIILVCLSAPSGYPMRGRLWFQLYRPHRTRSMKELAKTAVWLRDNRKFDSSCIAWMDDITGFVTTSLIGAGQEVFDLEGNTHTFYGRFGPIELMKRRRSAKDFLEWAQAFNICGIIILDMTRYPGTPQSSVSKASKHWFSWQGDLSKHWYPEFFFRVERMLKQQNWTKVEIPPYFLLYEPPKAKSSWFMDDTQCLDYEKLSPEEIQRAIPEVFQRFYLPFDPDWANDYENKLIPTQ